MGTKKRLRWLFAAAMLTVLIGAVFLMIRHQRELSFSNDPRFVVTALPTIDLPSNTTLRQRIFFGWFQFSQRFQKPNPSMSWFPASPTNLCSIQGMLNQCMEITGVRYVIAKDVAPGTIRFGHTNTLNGAQWVLAVTDLLQNGQPQIWDSQTKTFRKENLVLLTNDARTVLVLPKAMAQEFQTRKTN